MSQARFSVRTAVAEGFGFWRRNALKAVGPLAIAIAALAVLVTAQNLSVLVGALVVYLLGGIGVQGAFLRLALADVLPAGLGGNGPMGLQWRALETRLAILGLLIVVVLGFGALIAGLILNVLFILLDGAPATAKAANEASLADLAPGAQFIFKSAGLFAAALLLVLSSRLSLAAPATAADGRFRFLVSLDLTRGSVLRVLAATLAINLPIIAMQFFASLYVAGPGGPAAVPPTQFVIGAVSTFFYIPTIVGVTAYIYLRLRGEHG